MAESSVSPTTNLSALFVPSLFEFDSQFADGKNMVSEWAHGIPFYTTDNLSPDSPGFAPPPAGQNGSQGICQNPQGRCMSIATGLLNSMHATSPTCLLGSANQACQSKDPPRPVGAILSANQEALQVMRSLRECPCYATPQLQLLITAICAEALFWYRSIIHTYSQDHGTSLDGGGLLTSVVGTCRQAFSIGDHCLDGHLETTLISQVLSCRLKDLEDFIRDMGRNRADEECSAFGGEVGSKAMLRGVHVRIDTFLNSQMREIRNELLSLRDATLTEEGGYNPRAEVSGHGPDSWE
ncbi:hypothetical protein GGR51DRAFT_523137 [Nemania sp. FL0031]|nr:hypothetical protein GGR51DRAFT_523137 [Nemania sp. FL0031]